MSFDTRIDDRVNARVAKHRQDQERRFVGFYTAAILGGIALCGSSAYIFPSVVPLNRFSHPATVDLDKTREAKTFANNGGKIN
ncbi:hypothetical protein ACLOAV_003078 [Pseudogymnoascus australis]